MKPEVFLRTMQVNVIGPTLLYQAYLPLLEKGKRKTVVNMSSGLASIGLDLGGKCTSYSISKTALNMLVSISYILHHEGLHEPYVYRTRPTKSRKNVRISLQLSSIPVG